MVSSPELWIYLASNVGAVVAGGLLTGLSFLASRRRDDQPSYRFATVGFGLIVLGTLVDPIYLLGVASEYRPTTAELLLLLVGEDVLFMAGLGVLFYAIVRHDSSGPSTAPDPGTADEKRTWWQHSGDDD